MGYAQPRYIREKPTSTMTAAQRSFWCHFFAWRAKGSEKRCDALRMAAGKGVTGCPRQARREPPQKRDPESRGGESGR